jgi:hypothetical protein
MHRIVKHWMPAEKLVDPPFGIIVDPYEGRAPGAQAGMMEKREILKAEFAGYFLEQPPQLPIRDALGCPGFE